MKTFRYIIYLFAVVICFASCEKVVEFDEDETQTLVVMNACAQADSSFSAKLTYSRFFLDGSSFCPINDAQVILNVNGTDYNATTSGQKGEYSVLYKPQPGDSLTLRALIPGRDEVSASAKIPSRLSISDISTSHIYDSANSYYDPSWYNVSDNIIHFKFKLHDRADERNYYRIHVYYRDTLIKDEYYYNYNGSISDTVTDTLYRQQSSCEFKIIDPAIINASTNLGDIFDEGVETGSYEGSNLLFTDERINGHNHEIHLAINIPYLYCNYLRMLHSYVEVRVESISRDYYLYLATKEKQMNGNELTAIFSEPVRIHCNVKNGLGILGASSITCVPARVIIK